MPEPKGPVMTADPEKIMAMAMQRMEKVDAQMVRVYDKLDEIAKERRDEAREHGGLRLHHDAQAPRATHPPRAS